MIYMDEVKCHICKRIFCCAKCRQKHQFNTHAIAVSQKVPNDNQMMQHDAEGDIAHNDVPQATTTIYVFCPICEQKPLTLHKEIYAELLAHIESVHLPLRCRKCLRHYTKIDDLLDFSKCVNLSQNCSSSSSNSSSIDTNQSCDTDASKITVKKAMATVASNTISTQTSPCTGKDLNDTQQHYQRHLTPISLFNLRWKAKSRLTQEEFISDSVSSIRNLSTDSVNLSLQRRSIGQLTVASAAATATKGKVIRSTSTPLQVCSMFAKPKEAATFNASGGGGGAAHLSSIYHSGYVPEEQNTPAPPDSSQMPQQRAWKVGGRGKMSAVTPLRQVMSKSIQKAFVELATGGSSHPAQAQRRMRLDSSEANTPPDAFSAALDLRLSPVVRRTEQSMASSEAAPTAATEADAAAVEPYQILLSAQKLTTESIIITRTKHGASVSNSLPAAASTTNGSTTSTVYNSCESVEIITSSSSNIQQLTNAGAAIGAGVGAACEMPPITPITRIPGAVITKKLIKFETPQKSTALETGNAGDESLQEDREIFYTPNPGSQPASPSVDNNSSTKDRRRQQIVPRQLSGQFSNNNNSSPKEQRTLGPVKRPLGPRARPPLRACHHQKTFSCVQDVQSDNEYDDEEVFLPNSASTHNDNKKRAASSSSAEPGRLWSLMSSVMRLPATLRTDADKENAPSSTSGSLIRRCASIAGSLVRTMHGQDDDTDVQSMKRKRTQTLDNQYTNHLSSSPARSSKRVRIQPRKPIERMRTNY